MALHFSGAQSVTVADTGVLRPSTSVFLGAWVRPTSSTQAAYATIVGKELNNVSPYNSYQISMDSTANSLKLIGIVSVSGLQRITPSTVALTVSSWYWTALSWSTGGLVALRVYDSTLTLVDTQTFGNPSGTIDYDGSVFNIGEYVPGANSFLVGDVGSVIVAATASTGTADDINYGNCVMGNFPVEPAFFTGLCSTSPTDLSKNALAITNNGATLVANPPFTPCGAVAGVIPPLFGRLDDPLAQPLRGGPFRGL